jgi:hypothetical protein
MGFPMELLLLVIGILVAEIVIGLVVQVPKDKQKDRGGNR